MRCLSIADAGQCLGEHSLFASASRVFNEIITAHGHQNVVFHTEYKDMNGDLQLLYHLLSRYNPRILFVDSYYVTKDYLLALWSYCQKMSCKLIYIDDVFRFAYPCDILLNYNIYGTNAERKYSDLYQAAGIAVPRLLLGTKYVPLRIEFRNVGRKTKKNACNIFISTGGADTEHLAWKFALYIIDNIQIFSKIKFHFVLGTLNEDFERLKMVTNSVDSIILHYNVSNMSRLMQEMDIAISAAGSTLYELCATQTPTITYILADNQILGAKEFERLGVMQCLGDMRNSLVHSPGDLINAAMNLAGNFEERLRISTLQRKIVDGFGAERIIRAVLETQ